MFKAGDRVRSVSNGFTNNMSGTIERLVKRELDTVALVKFDDLGISIVVRHVDLVPCPPSR